ncbi:MAG: TRAP transporter substrate-binding protein DctP [Parvularculaceae bacterium]
MRNIRKPASPFWRARIAGALMTAMVTFAAACGAHAAEQVLRFGVYIPGRTITVREAMAPWAEDVSAASNGTLKIKLYSGGALGRNSKLQYWLMKQGVVDIAWMLPSETANRFPATDFFEIPLETADPMEMSVAFWRLYERGYLKGFDDIKPLALYVSPPYRFHLKFPYKDSDSLKGRKIRTVTHLQARLMKKAGATPVGGVSTTQVAESLSRGMIEGALFSWHGVKAVGIMQATDTHVDQPITFAPAIVAMNRDVYDSLTPDARAAIDALSGEPLVRRLVEVMNGQAERVMTAAKRDPTRHFVESDPDEADVWRARFEDAAEEWRARSPDHDALIIHFKEILEEIRAETRESDA